METVVGRDPYTQFAILLEYPREDIRQKIDEAIILMSGYSNKYPPEIVESLQEFLKGVSDMSLDDLQGIYSYTFEMSSDFTLDLGHHILDGFKRAEYLVHIKTMYRNNEFPFDVFSRGELPDHLPLVLRFLGFVQNEDLKKDFMRDFIIKALEKLNKNFSKTQANPYSHLINAVYRIIDRDIKEVK